MDSWQKRPARRWAAAAVAIGSATAVLASPFALGTASAAPVTGITIGTPPDPVPSTSPATATATLHATYTPAANPAPTDIKYAVTAGGDISGSGGLAGTACTADTSGGVTCVISNTSHAAASDTVKIFEDTGTTSGQLDGSDVLATPNAGVTVTFSGPPDAVSFTTAPTAGTTGTCADYTAHASLGGSGAAAGDQPLNLAVTETSAANPGATPITLFPTGCSNGGSTTSGNNVTGTGPYNDAFAQQVTTLPNGDVTFGLMTSATGTGTVKLSVPSNGAVSTSTVAVTWNAGGANSVTTVTPSPASTTQLTSTTASFTVTATNGGAPIQGVTINEETTGGPDSVTPTACGTTNSSGQATCTVHNGGTAGADALTFWVDNTSASCGHTTGPDSCEPQGHATATFNAAPAVSVANSSLTCIQQLAGADKGNPKTDCTVPTSQTSVTFTATVKDASGNPIANAPVTFTTTAAKLGGTTLSGSGLPAAATKNTGTDGTASYTVADATPANGDNATVSAAVGATTIGTATNHWATPTATSLSVTPPLQTVTNGGVVTIKAIVVDQFGTAMSGTPPTITYLVAGRNSAKTGNAASDGTITYTDAGTVPGQTTDQITVTDAADHFTGTANVVYVSGSTTASTVTVDTSGNGTADGNCAATGHTAATNVPLGNTTEVCAVVKNATAQALAGKAVTITVNHGQVAAHSGLTASSGTSYAATTDAAGVAFADVKSTTSGAQTVTAMADSATGSGTVTYASPVPTAAYAIAVSPTTATVNPGSQQKFTATVTDKFANPVSGVSVTFTQSGPGSIGGASSATVTTGTDGTASVTLSTVSTDSGAGSVAATIATAGTQCASAPTGTPPSSCTQSATYTVAATATPSALSLSAASGVRVGGHETVTATAKNSNGTPAANRVVRFFISGANSATGSATTNASGHASFSFVASHAGTDTIAAYVDTNNDQIREASEPKATTTAHIAPARAAEHPGIRLGTTGVSTSTGTVTVFVTTHPAARHALVRYFVKRSGVWHFIGANRTGASGHAAKTFREPAHKHLRFRVKVSATNTTAAGTSPSRGITVA